MYLGDKQLDKCLEAVAANYEIKGENRAKLKIRLIGLYTAPLDPSQSDQFLQKGDTESKNTLKGAQDQRPKASSSEVIRQSFVIGRIISEALVRSLTFLIKSLEPRKVLIILPKAHWFLGKFSSRTSITSPT